MMSFVLLPDWTVIGLLAILLGVLGSFFDKYLLRKYFSDGADDEGPGALLIFSSLFSALFSCLVFVVQFEYIVFSLRPALFGLLIGMLSGVWILLFLYALNRSEVSRIVPFFQAVPVFALLLGFMFLQEILTIEQMGAAGLIILSALILLYEPKHSVVKLDVLTLVIMLTVALLIALIGVGFKFVSLETNYWTAMLWESVGLALFGIFMFCVMKKFRNEFLYMVKSRARQVLGANSFNEVIDTTAEFTLFFAVTIGPIALVHSLNAYQPLLVLLGGIVLSYTAPAYFNDEFMHSTAAQKIIGITLMTIASVYLYTQI